MFENMFPIVHKLACHLHTRFYVKAALLSKQTHDFQISINLQMCLWLFLFRQGM